jgi:hypothetical protein
VQWNVGLNRRKNEVGLNGRGEANIESIWRQQHTQTSRKTVAVIGESCGTGRPGTSEHTRLCRPVRRGNRLRGGGDGRTTGRGGQASRCSQEIATIHAGWLRKKAK